MTARKPRCSITSRTLGESLVGTASTVTRWLLVEHSGAWAKEALESRGLPEPVRDHLTRLWSEWRIRVLLVRRRGQPQGSGVTVFAASTAAGAEWVERTELSDRRDLVDIDLSPLHRGRSVGFQPHEDPLFLVCTHGSHDACCGLFGRPVADALAEWWPVETWECSHVGGDRFAGNVVCLPAGVYFGRLDPDTAPTVIAGLLDGRVDLGHYRGRTSQPFAVQAAEIWVRRHLRLDGIDEVRPLDRSGDVVRFALDGGEERSVRVRVVGAEEPRYLTCAEVDMVRPPTFEVAWAD
jgi:hypothetical protein